ncbi:hypothetical protein [Haloplanus rubicundus]|uniref:Uncharacterized protein n=1 Tax=Haloplanus rubicundus TaxID=1547898 RepID=A0A345EBL3_9EURY|nr:hypothetical protein [Haloplanus rubicundus]AXG09585.1 hypothetical protein DU484_06715 [Haloplanus rubicundus]
MSPKSTLAFVVSLHFVLYALLVKPADGGNPAEAILLGLFSVLLLVAGVVNELIVVADPS